MERSIFYANIWRHCPLYDIPRHGACRLRHCVPRRYSSNLKVSSQMTSLRSKRGTASQGFADTVCRVESCLSYLISRHSIGCSLSQFDSWDIMNVIMFPFTPLFKWDGSIYFFSYPF